MRMRILALILGIGFVTAMGVWAAMSPKGEYEIARYATTLRGRTDSQIFNARLAASRVNNVVVQPGHTFSFLETVGPWTADMGYKKAPVSYDGELVRSWGGGVCQVSSTLYNAALLAGLEIVERHRHYFPARYAPLGRDAAVAYHDIDLRFRNNLPEPIRIIGRVEGENLVFGIRSAHEPSYTVRIECQTRSVKPPQEVVQNRSGKDAGAWRLVNRGHAGFNVATYRIFTAPDGVRKELIAEDSYPAMNRVIRLTEQ